MTKFKQLYLLFILLSSLFSMAQGTHSTRFNFSDYNGGHENWDICEIGSNLVIANQQGLLLFQNGKWNINLVPENIAPKAVFYKNNKLYTAFGSRFGYFEIKNQTIQGNFHPIILPKEAQLFNLVWKIVADENYIYFQTDKNVLKIKDSDFIKELPFSGFVRCIFEINKDIYFVDHKLGLLKNFKKIPNGDSLAGKEINVILPFENGSLLISNFTDKTFLKFQDTVFKKFMDSTIIQGYPFCGIKIEDAFLLGTTENGVYEINENGKIKNHYNKENNLAFNKVFALKMTDNNILWVGLENGLERFRFDLPFKNIDFNNQHGNSINAETIDSLTFFLTSKGIFTSETENIFSSNKNNMVNWNQTIGPYYFLKKVSDTYVYGGLNGLYQYRNGQTKKISKNGICKNFKKINDTHFIVNLENEWLLYANQNDSIHFIKSLSLPSKFVLIEDKIVWNYGNQIMVQNFDSKINFMEKQNFTIGESIERLFLKNDTLFFTNSLGTYYIKSTDNKKIVTKKYSNHTIYKIDNEITLIDPLKLNRKIFYDSNNPLKDQCSYFISEILKINKDKINFIKQLNDTLLVLGSYRGYTMINLKKLQGKNAIQIEEFSACFEFDKKTTFLKKFTNDLLFLVDANLKIELLLNEQFYPLYAVYRYKYKLNGTWFVGEWQENNILEINSLKKGKYQMYVEIKDWFGNSKTLDLGKFNIEKEHLLNLSIKLIILAIILIFLLAALHSAILKKRDNKIDNPELG